MSDRFRHAPRCFGFTFVELILVLLIVGILAVFAAPRLNVNAFSSRSNLDTVRSILSYGQKIAVAQHRQVFVVFSGGNAALCFDATCNARVLTPSNTPAVLPAGTTGPNFSFNALGQASGTGVITVTLSDGSTVLIQSETGYVQ